MIKVSCVVMLLVKPGLKALARTVVGPARRIGLS